MVKMVTLIEHMNQITVGMGRKSLTLSLADKIQHYVILQSIEAHASEWLIKGGDPSGPRISLKY